MAIPNRGPELQAVCYTLLIASVIALGLRVYVRLRLVKNFGFDDWCMCCALVSSSLSDTHLTHSRTDYSRSHFSYSAFLLLWESTMEPAVTAKISTQTTSRKR
jgi:hypothetical protein